MSDAMSSPPVPPDVGYVEDAEAHHGIQDDGHEDIVVRVDHIGESYACLQCDDGRRDSFGVVRVVCCPDAAAHGIAQLIPLQLVEPGPESVAHLCSKGRGLPQFLK